MYISSVTFLELDDPVELWIESATDQRTSGPHLRAEIDRTPTREALARYAAASGVLVARKGGVNNGSTEVGSNAEDASTDGLVGFVMFDIEAGAYERDVACGVVRSLFVRPAYRDVGIGTRLLAAAEDAPANAGVDAAALDVLADNEAVRRFYQRRGYRPRRVGLEKLV